jgi:phenylpropionate dioxygenase-like ring-hydroxylating dioxygenase large terminal subunit
MSATAPNSSASWYPPVASEQRNYPYNCWWVAGLSSQIGRELLGRWLLDTPVLLYRKEDGSPVAIEDRCPHRAAPLSLGTLLGDDVQCGYHGFTFSSDGRCLRVPSMKAPPAAARVRSFPVIEQGPFIWIYLGDPDRIEEAPLPHVLEWVDDPSFAKVEGIMELSANYMLLKENVLDLTHFGYVHASSFKITDWVDPPRFTTDGDIVSYHATRFCRAARHCAGHAL